MKPFYMKSNKTGNSNIIFHQIHDQPVYYPPPLIDFWRIVSIDPGKKNLAIRIDKRYNDGRIEVELYQKINIPFEITDVVLSDTCPIKYNDLYFKVLQLFDNYKSYFLCSNIIIIERQILPNYDMIRLCQHFITYFSILLRNACLQPILLEVEPGFKNRFFSMPKGSNAHKWVVEVALEIMKSRKDEMSIQMISSCKGKADDLAVTLVQCEAVLQYLKWAMPFCSN